LREHLDRDDRALPVYRNIGGFDSANDAAIGQFFSGMPNFAAGRIFAGPANQDDEIPARLGHHYAANSPINDSGISGNCLRPSRDRIGRGAGRGHRVIVDDRVQLMPANSVVARTAGMLKSDVPALAPQDEKAAAEQEMAQQAERQGA